MTSIAKSKIQENCLRLILGKARQIQVENISG